MSDHIENACIRWWNDEGCSWVKRNWSLARIKPGLFANRLVSLAFRAGVLYQQGEAGLKDDEIKSFLPPNSIIVKTHKPGDTIVMDAAYEVGVADGREGRFTIDEFLNWIQPNMDAEEDFDDYDKGWTAAYCWITENIRHPNHGLAAHARKKEDEG